MNVTPTWKFRLTLTNQSLHLLSQFLLGSSSLNRGLTFFCRESQRFCDELYPLTPIFLTELHVSQQKLQVVNVVFAKHSYLASELLRTTNQQHPFHLPLLVRRWNLLTYISLIPTSLNTYTPMTMCHFRTTWLLIFFFIQWLRAFCRPANNIYQLVCFRTSF